MKLRLFVTWFFVASIVAAAIYAAQSASPNGVIASSPVYNPDMSRQNQHLPDTVLRWDAVMKTTNVPEGTLKAHLSFSFTNVNAEVNRTLTTNVALVVYKLTSDPLLSPHEQKAAPQTRAVTVTNLVWVTNSITEMPVVITDVHPSCGCTTAQLPHLPWTIAPGTNSQIGVTVNLAGKFGTLVKTVHVATDQGWRDLIVQITLVSQPAKRLTQADLDRQMAIAKVDRQAVFKGDCATCHMTPGQGLFGPALFKADCAICHEAEHRATMVPDLHNLKVPTNEEFWRTWIAHGKPGSLMPAFSTADGGPLDDMQIASLSAYLSEIIPSKVPQPQ
jgi:mono/diheme cytochrome c family protein